MPKRAVKTGLWMVGACGSVGSTVALGVAALRRKLTPTAGLVTALPPFDQVDLVDPAAFVLGGHEIRETSFQDEVQALHDHANLFHANLIKACAPQLRAWRKNVRPGTLVSAGRTVRRLADPGFTECERNPAAVVERLSGDLVDFRRRHKLDHVVVVHVASSEPRARKRAVHARFSTLSKALARSDFSVLPPSALYALAAVEARCAFINFTPSLGIDVPAIRQRAEECHVPYMGRDGKTGESLVKSALAPMFSMRNLSVLSWFGQNLLGNRDGEVLRDPKTRASKIKSKDKIVSGIVGGRPIAPVSISYVPSLDDWKVAWDFIHFEGFLGTRMRMQFTWQGSDSILAAPIILDLARLTVRECEAERCGAMKHLAFFFKDPIGVKEQDLYTQWRRLTEHAAL